MSTSRSDVYFRLVLLDYDVELCSSVGHGHAVIPAYTLHTNSRAPTAPTAPTAAAVVDNKEPLTDTGL